MLSSPTDFYHCGELKVAWNCSRRQVSTQWELQHLPKTYSWLTHVYSCQTSPLKTLLFPIRVLNIKWFQRHRSQTSKMTQKLKFCKIKLQKQRLHFQMLLALDSALCSSVFYTLLSLPNYQYTLQSQSTSNILNLCICSLLRGEVNLQTVGLCTQCCDTMNML